MPGAVIILFLAMAAALAAGRLIEEVLRADPRWIRLLRRIPSASLPALPFLIHERRRAGRRAPRLRRRVRPAPTGANAEIPTPTPPADPAPLATVLPLAPSRSPPPPRALPSASPAARAIPPPAAPSSAFPAAETAQQRPNHPMPFHDMKQEEDNPVRDESDAAPAMDAVPIMDSPVADAAPVVDAAPLVDAAPVLDAPLEEAAAVEPSPPAAAAGSSPAPISPFFDGRGVITERDEVMAPIVLSPAASDAIPADAGFAASSGSPPAFLSVRLNEAADLPPDVAEVQVLAVPPDALPPSDAIPPSAGDPPCQPARLPDDAMPPAPAQMPPTDQPAAPDDALSPADAVSPDDAAAPEDAVSPDGAAPGGPEGIAAVTIAAGSGVAAMMTDGDRLVDGSADSSRPLSRRFPMIALPGRDEIRIGLIGGSGMGQALSARAEGRRHEIDTPFGRPSDAIIETEWEGMPVFFLSRHGPGHLLNPTHVPYRANLFALKRLGVTHVIASGAVGSLRDHYRPRDLVVVDQAIDQTRRRAATFFERAAVHVEMAEPFCPVLRRILLEAGAQSDAEAPRENDMTVHDAGCYVCMEGPGFSTRAESLMHRLMGGDLIGMTAMPEAKLAREAEMSYALVALVTDYDCWRRPAGGAGGAAAGPADAGALLKEIIANLEAATDNGIRLIRRAVAMMSERKAELAAAPAQRALELAIWSDRSRIPPDEVELLAPLWMKYFGEEAARQSSVVGSQQAMANGD